MTLIQSRSFVYRFFNLPIYSFVIKIAILVNKAVLGEITIQAPGLIRPIVELRIVEALPTNISVINNNSLFYSNFYISSDKVHYHF